jgi:electron transport complex protein RnfG
MKIVFKIIFFAWVAFVTLPARADQVYFTSRDLLADFFRSSQQVTYKKMQIDGVDRDRISKRLGYALPRTSYTFYVASSGGRIDGYALIDEEKGEHLPITFAVKLSPEGKVQRQEVVVYREVQGDEVRDDRFRRQFVGKSAHDQLELEQDIVAVSGATISSRAMTVGVKRALVLFDELVRPAATAHR